VRLANQLGQCDFNLSEVSGDKVVRYRDTTGVSKEVYRDLLAVPDRSTLKGKRDYAILRLLWDNALRRGEIESADIKDLDTEGRTLAIFGKGRGQQKETVSLSRPTLDALVDWLQERRGRGEQENVAPPGTSFRNNRRSRRNERGRAAGAEIEPSR